MTGKQLWIWAPALALAASLISGCGGGGSPSFGSTSNTGAPSPDTSPFTGTYYISSINDPQVGSGTLGCGNSPIITVDSDGDEAACAPDQTVVFSGNTVTVADDAAGLPNSSTFQVVGTTVIFHFTDVGSAQTASASYAVEDGSLVLTLASTTDPAGLPYIGLVLTLGTQPVEGKTRKA
jgi:hypothetical protein